MPRRQPVDEDKMSLQDYLGLYQMFSPQQNIATAAGVDKLRTSQEGDQYANRLGYPNLTAMDISERHQERQDVTKLREQAVKQSGGDRELEGIMHMANLATNVGDLNTARSALQLLKQRYGIQDQPQEQGSDLEKKLRAIQGKK